MKKNPDSAWLILVHQLPPTPAYLRVKVARRLHGIGAIAMKSTVYALPSNDQTLEDFQWLRREITDCGGEATIMEARFIEGFSAHDAASASNAARNAEYAAVAEDAQRALKDLKGPVDVAACVATLRKRLGEIQGRDWLGARGLERAANAVKALERKAGSGARRSKSPKTLPLDEYQGRTWVTRSGVYVDRIASAWLVARFIDARAKFRFVASRNPRLEKGELGFDMFEAAFTHEGESCTFEVLLTRFGLEEGALLRIAGIVHDLDIKDGKFDHAETAGAATLFSGIALKYKKDEQRLEQGFAALDSLYEHFKRTLA